MTICSESLLQESGLLLLSMVDLREVSRRSFILSIDGCLRLKHSHRVLRKGLSQLLKTVASDDDDE